MPPAPQQQQQSSSDSGMGPIWVIVLLFLTLYLIWVTGHKYIVKFVFSLNILHAQLVNFFMPGAPLAKEVIFMQTLDPNSVDWEHMVALAEAVGDYIRYPLIVILVILAVVLYGSNPIRKFCRSHSMKTLRAQEQANWPAIMPVVPLDLVNDDINVGPWAMALTPMEFARKYQLLKKDDVLLDKSQPGQEMTAGIRRSDAKRVFTLQLGPCWTGFDNCAGHVQVLAAVFMARMNRDRGVASAILQAIDHSAAIGHPDYSVAIPTFKKYQSYENVQEIVAQHAYLLTVMASLLAASRDDGVVPSSEFLWLKPIDRRLWYMLNGVGRQTPFAEVSGPFAHWKAEQKLGHRSLLPMIDEAIKALEIAVKEVKLTPKQMRELQP